MTVNDISADFPEFKKNLKRLKKLQKNAPYLEIDDVKKTSNVVDLLDKSSIILRKVDNMDNLNDVGSLKPEPPEETAPPIEPKKLSEQQAKVIEPKMKELASAKRDMSFTVPSTSPEENYASEKYSRLSENYSTGLNTEINNYSQRIMELSQGQKAGWLEQSVTEFGRWTAAEQFKTRMNKVGLTGALEWLADSIEQSKEDRLDIYEYLETEETGEFNDEFKDALSENEFYKDGYTNSLENLYKTFYPQLYKSFIEEADEVSPDPLIKSALQDIPNFKNDEIGKMVLKQTVTDQLYRKYGEAQSKKLAKQIGKYIDANYSSLDLNKHRTQKTDVERHALLNEYSDADTIQNLLRLQGFRDTDVDKLAVDLIGERDYPELINKFVGELRINPKFHKNARTAEATAARIFGEEFEKYYNPELADSYKRSNPYYIKHLVSHANYIIDKYNESTPGNFRRIPSIKLKGKDGELKKEDIETIDAFFKTDGKRLSEFLGENKKLKDSISGDYLQRLELIDKGKGLSYMTDRDNNAAIFLDNILTENRGKKESEHRRGVDYFSEGMAFFTDPRSEDNKLYMKELLNSPIFMDPLLLSKALIADEKNPKSSGKLRLLVEEVLPLVTGSYYKGRTGRNERRLMSAEQLAVEDYQNNPFVQRMRAATKSPENFRMFLEFLNGAVNDIGNYEGKNLIDVALNPGVEKFLRNVGDKPELDSKALKMQPIRNKTEFEKLFFRTPDQHVNQMAELEKKGMISENPEIGASAKVFAFPIYKKYFNDFVNAYNEIELGAETSSKFANLRQSLIGDLNKKIAPTLFEDNRGNPYNYFAEVYDIEDPEIRNGVLEAAYILKKFDEDFYKRLLAARVDKKGIVNPDLEAKIEQPVISEPEPVQATIAPPAEVAPPVPTIVEEKPVEQTKLVEQPKQEPVIGPKEVEDLMRVQDQEVIPEGTVIEEVGDEDFPDVENMPEIIPAEEEYKRREREERTASNDNPEYPPAMKENIKVVKKHIGSEMQKNIHLRALLTSGGVLRENKKTTKPQIVDWEDATDEEKGIALYNALLQLSTEGKPWGLNNIKNGKIILAGKRGLDSFIPREWIENAIKRYIDRPGINIIPPATYKKSNEYINSRGEVKANPWEISSLATTELHDIGEKKESKLPTSAGGTANKAWMEATNRVQGKKKEAIITGEEKKELETILSKVNEFGKYLANLISVSQLSDEPSDPESPMNTEKNRALEAVKKMVNAIQEGNISIYEQGRKELSSVIGGESKIKLLEPNLMEEADPYTKEAAEVRGNPYDSKIASFIDKEGRIADVSGFMNILLNDLDEFSRLSNNIISKPMRMASAPTANELKEISNEYLNIIEDRINSPKFKDKFSKTEWEHYQKWFPQFRRAINEGQLTEANTYKKELMRIPGHVYNFDKVLGMPLSLLDKQIKDQEEERIIKEKLERQKKKKKKEKPEQATIVQEQPEEVSVEEAPKDEVEVFNPDTYKTALERVKKEVEDLFRTYPLSQSREDVAKSLLERMFGAITMMDEKDYKESKNDLAMIWDESMLNDFLFPLADEMMKYRMLANK